MKPTTIRLGISMLGILLLWLGLIVAAAYGEPTAQLIKADTATAVFRGFEPPEQSGDYRYRWTKGDALIAVPAHPSATGLIVDLQLTGPQWAGAIPTNQTIRLDQGQAISVNLPPAWRHYRLLLPRGSVGWGKPLIHITGTTQSPGIGDSRSLGAALSQVKIVSVPDPRSLMAIERGAFLLILVLAFGVIVLLSSSWRWSIIATSVFGLMICIAQWLFPVLCDTLFPVDRQIGALVAAAIVASSLTYGYGKLLAQSVAGITFALIGILLTPQLTWAPLGMLLIIGGGVLIGVTIPGWYHNQRSVAVQIWLAGVVLGVLVVLLYTYNLGTFGSIHPDELFWMSSGRRAFQLFFVEYNYTDPFWFNFGEYFLAYHPQIGKFLIGASVAAAGIPELPNQPFDWTQSVAWNIHQGFYINPTALLAARIPVAISAIVACLTLYWLGIMVASWWQGFLAAVCLAGNGAMLALGRWAMLDVPTLCFSLLTIALIVRAVQALRSGQNGLKWAVVAGIMAGLAVGSKLIAVALVGPAVLVLLYEALRCRWQSVGTGYGALVCTAMLIGLSAFVFYVSNPLLYGQPIAGTLQMLEFVRLIQKVNIINPTSTPIERMLAIWESPTYYGILTIRFNLPIDRILIILGCLAIGIDLWRIPALRQQPPLDIVVIWMVASTLLIMVSLPANIDRYLLPLQPIAAFLQAYGTIWVASRAVMLIRKRFGSMSAKESSSIS